MRDDKTGIYLDYNASTPLRPAAWHAMEPFLKADHAAYNASAVHMFGREGRKAIETARTQIAALINAPHSQIIFNSGATEGNNTLLRYFSETYPDETILISAIEHPSILKSVETLKNVRCIPVDHNGLVQLDYLEEKLQNTKVSLLSCLYAQNETGVIQDVSKLSSLAHHYGALFHCDSVQAAGRIPINMQESGLDFLTLSSHKIGGPQGVGALALGLCTETPTLFFGGGQEKSARAGTENVAGIAGFGAAAQTALETRNDNKRIAALKEKLEHKIKEISPDVIIHAQDAQRLSNTSFFSLPTIDAQSLLMALDLDGIAINSGSACSSGSIKPSTTLHAMGCNQKIATNALRVSTGWATKEQDIDDFLHIWAKIIARMQQ